MKKEKGFTLIEVIGVIVVLGILAMITIPQVMDAVNSGKMNTFKDSIYSLLKAIDLDKDYHGDIAKLYTVVDGVISPKVSFDGELQGDGTIDVNEEGKIAVQIETIDWCAIKHYDDSKIKVTEGVCTENPLLQEYAVGTALYFNPYTGLKCDAASAWTRSNPTSQCFKWYVIQPSPKQKTTVELFLDHEIGVAQWNSTGVTTSGPKEVLSYLKTATASFKNVVTLTASDNVTRGTYNGSYTIPYAGYKARLVSGQEIADAIGASAWSSSESKEIKIPIGKQWIYENTSNDAGEDGLWVYWTDTAPIRASDDIAVWNVTSYAQFIAGSTAFSSQIAQVRPVIRVLKSNF